jgi:mannose-6-phosphate isomerase-like protein (cupin superfamily)
MITRRDLAAAAIAASITLACVSLPTTAQGAGLHRVELERSHGQERPTSASCGPWCAATRTLDELEMHITTLNPHTASHPPHTHPNEEMVIVKEGTLQAHVNGKEIVVPAVACCSTRRCSHTRCRTSAIRPHLLRDQLGQPRPKTRRFRRHRRRRLLSS